MFEILNVLAQVFAVFGAGLFVAGMMKRQKRNDDQMRPIPIRVQAQRRIRRK